MQSTRMLMMLLVVEIKKESLVLSKWLDINPFWLESLRVIPSQKFGS